MEYAKNTMNRATATPEQARRLARWGAAALSLVTLAAWAMQPALAADPNWMYRRSYFSHVLPSEAQANYPVPTSRSAYRVPMVQVYPGFSVQGAYRYDPVVINDGQASDVTIYRQFWAQYQP